MDGRTDVRSYGDVITKFSRLDGLPMAVIGVEPAVKYSFVLKGMQTRRKGQYNAELTLLPRLYVKPLITPITAIFLIHGASLARFAHRSPAKNYGRKKDCEVFRPSFGTKQPKLQNRPKFASHVGLLYHYLQHPNK